jgi:hypothetical protein
MPDAETIGRTPEEVRRFAAALLEVDTSDDADEPETPAALAGAEDDHLQIVYTAVDAGLRFATGLLAADPSDEALELLVRAASLPENDADTDAAVREQALAVLAHAMDPGHGEVVAAVRSACDAVRRAMARALDPRTAQGRAHLQRLAGDAHAEVRNLARERLTKAGHEVAWWAGLFPDDPFATLAPEEAAAAAGPLGELAGLLGDPPTVTGTRRIEAIVGALGQLPDRLAVALVPRIVPAEPWALRALVPALLAREGGAAALVGLARDHDLGTRLSLASNDLAAAMASLPAERRAEVRAVLGAVRPEGEDDPAAEAMFALAMACADPSEDLWPEARRLVEAGDYRGLQQVLRWPPVPGTPLAEEAGRAASEGFPGAWSDVRWAVEPWVASGPAAWLRPLAERAIRSESASARRWGLATLTGEAFDPARDGDRGERAAALALDPRFAADFLEDRRLTARALPMLRARLRRGESTLDEALAAIGACAGTADVEPATPEEWAELRRLRDEALRSDPERAREKDFYLEVREPGHPEDQALLERLVADATTPQRADDLMALLLRTGRTGSARDERHPADLELGRVLRDRFPDARWVQAGWRLLARQT